MGVWWAFPTRTDRRLKLFHSGVRIERLEQFHDELQSLLTRKEHCSYNDPTEHLQDLIKDLRRERTN